MQPQAPIEPEGTFAGLRGGAILFGAFVDIAATVIASTLLLWWLAPDAISPDEAKTREVLARLYASTAYLIGNLVLGALCTVLGAFAGARRAGQLHVRHGGWIAVASTMIGTLLSLLERVPAGDPAAVIPFWAEALAWLLILPAGVTGGALAKALHRPSRF
jgi:hypothetical protein